MPLIGQAAVIAAICLAGELAAALLPVKLPASLMSMALLLLFLFTRLIKLRHIQDVARFLSRNMAFFFLPAGVGILGSLDLVRGHILALLAVVALTTVITFAAAGYTTLAVMRLMRRREAEQMEEGESKT